MACALLRSVGSLRFADAIKHQVKAVNILEETRFIFEMGRAFAALGRSYNGIQDSPEDYHSVTGALIVGNPSLPPQTKLPSLPGARREALEIAELLGVSATVGDEATKK